MSASPIPMPMGNSKTATPNPTGSTYPANGYNPMGNGNFNFQSLFPQLDKDAFNTLNKVYGNGFGSFLGNFINGGAGYNPQVLQTEINQIQPEVQKGIATLGASAGAGGSYYSSGHDVGLADYLSQVNQNENAMAANLYENSLSNVMNLTGNLMNPVSQLQNNQGGFWQSLLTSIIPSLTGTGDNAGVLGNILGKIPGLGGIFGSHAGGGSGGGSTSPTLQIPGGGHIPIPGTNDGYGTYNPPASGNTGIPGGQISAESGNALLDFLHNHFNMQPGSQFPNIGAGQISGIAGGQTSVPYDTAGGIGDYGNIPMIFEQLPL